MSLFDDLTPNQKTVMQIRDSAIGARALLLASMNNIEAMIWANPYGLTPQEVFTALGKSGKDLLAVKAAVLPIFAAAGGEQPRQLRPEGVTLSADDDGNVTIREG